MTESSSAEKAIVDVRKYDPVTLLKLKEELKNKFEELLSDDEKERAKKDAHARRAPRWCGLTIHVTINCPFRCIYCYIEDMGFRFESPKPYPLSGRELAYAVLNNEFFLPTRHGTLLAVGSVSEPFVFIEKAVEYISWLAKLGNPIQFSTKQYISPQLAEKLAGIARETGAPISPLVTIITLSKSDVLEPKAPSPEKRLDSIKNLRDAGLKPVLFLRPVIPGVNDDEVFDVIRAAKDAGAYGVLIGGFRVTRRILRRLEEAGLDTAEIKRRVRVIDDSQRAVQFPEKSRIVIEARNLGVISWASACCVNAWNAGAPCPSACFIDGPCVRCPNACSFERDSPDPKRVEEALQMLGINGKVRGKKVIVKVEGKMRGIESLVRTLSRRSVKVMQLTG